MAMDFPELRNYKQLLYERVYRVPNRINKKKLILRRVKFKNIKFNEKVLKFWKVLDIKIIHKIKNIRLELDFSVEILEARR